MALFVVISMVRATIHADFRGVKPRSSIVTRTPEIIWGSLFRDALNTEIELPTVLAQCELHIVLAHWERHFGYKSCGQASKLSCYEEVTALAVCAVTFFALEYSNCSLHKYCL